MKELNTSSVMGEYLVAFSETKRIQKRSALFFSVTKKEKKQYVFNAIQGPLSVLVLNISGQRKQRKNFLHPQTHSDKASSLTEMKAK